jgi:hypothetical protein
MKKQQTKPKICIKCFKPIEEKSNYYSFTEYNNLKIIHIDYAHRTCWDDFLKQLGSLKNAQDMLSRMQEPLERMGLLQPKEVIIG